VAAHDWATWHLNNQSKTAKCQMLIGPCVCQVCPCHLYLPVTCPVSLPRVPATSACATCHPYSGDTCHPLIGPTVPVVCHITCHVSSPGAATSSVSVRPYGLYSQPATWHCTDCTDCTVIPFFLPVWVFGQNAISFAYGARLTK
jgi:hypothetical protein